MRLLLASRATLLVSVVIASAAAAWAGCGGESFNQSTGGGGHATGSGGGNQGGSTSTTDQGGASSTSGGNSTGATTANGGGGSSATGGGGGGNATGGGGGGNNMGCPNPSGYYAMISKVGAGCGDLNTNAPACASASDQICQYHLSSGGNQSVVASVNGAITLQQDGSFMGATIYEGSSTQPRTGCQGTFDNGVLTIICGDVTKPNDAQYCKATLTRTADACPGQN